MLVISTGKLISKIILFYYAKAKQFKQFGQSMSLNLLFIYFIKLLNRYKIFAYFPFLNKRQYHLLFFNGIAKIYL